MTIPFFGADGEAMAALDLTKKGEAYAAAATLTVFGHSDAFMSINIKSPRAIADGIDALIHMLDELDPDPDLEDNADDEPSHGWTGEGRGATALYQHINHDDEREEVSEDEGAYDGDTEYSFGWQNDGTQERLDMCGGYCCGEGEPDLGFVGHGTGWREGEGLEDLEDQCEDEGAQCDDEGVVESGIADSDALHSLEGNGAAFGDGSGNAIAKRLLERARRGPMGVIVREIIDGPEFRQ